MIHAEISIYPIGTGSTSTIFYIARALEVLQEMNGIRYHLTAMGTLLKSDSIRRIYEASERMMEAVHSLGVARVGVVLKIDSRSDRQTRLEDKVESAKAHLERF